VRRRRRRREGVSRSRTADEDGRDDTTAFGIRKEIIVGSGRDGNRSC
jgi:hypothetical protein